MSGAPWTNSDRSPRSLSEKWSGLFYKSLSGLPGIAPLIPSRTVSPDAPLTVPPHGVALGAHRGGALPVGSPSQIGSPHHAISKTPDLCWFHTMRMLLDVLHRDSHSRATRIKIRAVETRRRDEDDCGEPDCGAVCRMPGNKHPEHPHLAQWLNRVWCPVAVGSGGYAPTILRSPECEWYQAALRRQAKPIPARPIPTRAIVLGSGTGVVPEGPLSPTVNP